MPDFEWLDHGSVWVLLPLTAAAVAFANDVYEEAQRWGPDGVVVEPRYVESTTNQLTDEGFTFDN